MEPPQLGELLAAMAVDAINVQLKFDQHFATEIQRLPDITAAAQSGTVAPELLLPLLPQRLRLDHFDLSFHAGIRLTREEEFAIRAVPLNAQFFIRTGATTLGRKWQQSVALDYRHEPG